MVMQQWRHAMAWWNNDSDRLVSSALVDVRFTNGRVVLKVVCSFNFMGFSPLHGYGRFKR